ncbi:hypothetical protein ABH940_002846 [Streptacidiphilus sp. BW17]|uniref:hypothetical protein n=1 Tax=Streptacidiphilus sp. BW17 TaxID=3156274 RepID=UPI00351782C0
MRNRQRYHRPQQHGPTGDRPVAKLAAWSAAVAVVWAFHHQGIAALAGAAGAYLLVLIVLKAWLGGAR